MAHGTVHGKPLTTNKDEDHQQQELDDREQVKQRAEALVRRIGQACDELERLAEENPELVGRVTHGAEEHKEAYLRLKARLALAEAAPRCRWVRQDGTTCGSPQDEETHLLLCPQADGRGTGAGADAAGAGGRECNPGGTDANTEGAD